MFEKLEELAKNNKKISDFHIRSGWPLAYRQTGEIYKVKEVIVKAQDLNDLISSVFGIFIAYLIHLFRLKKI